MDGWDIGNKEHRQFLGGISLQRTAAKWDNWRKKEAQEVIWEKRQHVYKLMGMPKYRVKSMLHWSQGEDDVIK